jgi:hypothetical protein
MQNNQNQLTLPGLDHLFVTSLEWRPIPNTLERLKEYFLGYLANGREIYARRRYIAKKLQMSVRTLARYLKWLRDDGWIATVRRTSRTAYRQVIKAPVPSTVPSQEPPPITEVTSKPETSAALPTRILNVVHRAAARIRRAKNPAAYRQAIISCELRLLKASKPTKPTASVSVHKPSSAEDRNALERFVTWAGGNLDALRKTV